MVDVVLGTKARIRAQNKYAHTKKAIRHSRTEQHTGLTRTHKKKGDIILTSTGKVEVRKTGWY